MNPYSASLALLFSLARKKPSGLESAATIRTKVFVWGLNDKDQLGGLKGSKVPFLLMNQYRACVPLSQIKNYVV